SARDALQKNEERLNLVLSAGTDGLWDWDLATGHIWRSQGWETILGYEMDETPPDLAAWEKLVHPDDLPRVSKIIHDHLEGVTPGYMNEYRILKRNGEWTWLQDRGKVVERDFAGRPLRVVGAFHDIHQRKEAERDLRESEERFRSLFESSLDGILFSAPDGRVFNANQAACSIFGASEQELREMGRAGLVDTADPRLRPALEERARTGRFRGELNFKRKDGTVIPVEISSTLFRTANGEDRAGIIVRDITERNRAEQALRETQAELHAIYENAPVMMCVLDGERRVLYANRAFAEFVGKNESELRESRACGVCGCANALDDQRGCGYGPNCGPCPLRSAIEETHGTGVGRQAVEYRSTLVGNGEARDVVLLGSTASIQAGGSTRVLLCLEDITERKRVEDALRESEERYRSFFETSRDAIFITTLDGKLVDVNEAALELIGYDSEGRDEFMREGVAGFYSNPAERAAHAELVLKTGFSKEYPVDLRKKDGTIVHALVTTVVRRDRDGNVIGFQGTIRDVTEQRRSTELLATTLRRFYTILSSLYSGVLIVAEDGRVEFVNPAFCRLFDLDDPPENLRGLTSPEMIAKIVNVYADPAEAVTRIREVVARNRPVKGEQIAIGGGRTYMVDYVPIVVDGKSLGRLWHHNDITDLKVAEVEREALKNRLFQAQKMESIGTLTGGIAHDFNNLLTIINGYAELILAERTELDPLYADLKKILVTGAKGADLVRRLQAFSKRADINPRTLDLNGVVENSVNLMRRTFPKIIEIEVVPEPGPVLVNADDSQVGQVLMNLAINAKEAMTEGGRMRIEVRKTSITEDHGRLHHGVKPGPYVIVAISDTGKGMTRDTMDRMFDPFFTTKGWDFKKGTGLGLSVAQGIVEQHGGWITCDSEPGAGTTFRVYLPTIESYPEAGHAEPSTLEKGTGRGILLVDDEEYVRDLGTRILQSAGYDVRTAADGLEALEIYAREGEGIGLVVLDLVMPQMGGEKCLEGLLKINPNAKVIVSTGNSSALGRTDPLAAHVKGFVDKPYRVQQFLEIVARLLEDPGRPPG
ncbi:MAG: PAS domain S-box protein, partial [Pseudomonadota bacterium]